MGTLVKVGFSTRPPYSSSVPSSIRVCFSEIVKFYVRLTKMVPTQSVHWKTALPNDKNKQDFILMLSTCGRGFEQHETRRLSLLSYPTGRKCLVMQYSIPPPQHVDHGGACQPVWRDSLVRGGWPGVGVNFQQRDQYAHTWAALQKTRCWEREFAWMLGDLHTNATSTRTHICHKTG